MRVSNQSNTTKDAVTAEVQTEETSEELLCISSNFPNINKVASEIERPVLNFVIETFYDDNDCIFFDNSPLPSIEIISNNCDSDYKRFSHSITTDGRSNIGVAILNDAYTQSNIPVLSNEVAVYTEELVHEDEDRFDALRAEVIQLSKLLKVKQDELDFALENKQQIEQEMTQLRLKCTSKVKEFGSQAAAIVKCAGVEVNMLKSQVQTELTAWKAALLTMSNNLQKGVTLWTSKIEREKNQCIKYARNEATEKIQNSERIFISALEECKAMCTSQIENCNKTMNQTIECVQQEKDALVELLDESTQAQIALKAEIELKSQSLTATKSLLSVAMQKSNDLKSKLQAEVVKSLSLQTELLSRNIPIPLFLNLSAIPSSKDYIMTSEEDLDSIPTSPVAPPMFKDKNSTLTSLLVPLSKPSNILSRKEDIDGAKETIKAINSFEIILNDEKKCSKPFHNYIATNGHFSLRGDSPAPPSPNSSSLMAQCQINASRVIVNRSSSPSLSIVSSHSGDSHKVQRSPSQLDEENTNGSSSEHFKNDDPHQFINSPIQQRRNLIRETHQPAACNSLSRQISNQNNMNGSPSSIRLHRPKQGSQLVPSCTASAVSLVRHAHHSTSISSSSNHSPHAVHCLPSEPVRARVVQLPAQNVFSSKHNIRNIAHPFSPVASTRCNHINQDTSTLEQTTSVSPLKHGARIQSAEQSAPLPYSAVSDLNSMTGFNHSSATAVNCSDSKLATKAIVNKETAPSLPIARVLLRSGGISDAGLTIHLCLNNLSTRPDVTQPSMDNTFAALVMEPWETPEEAATTFLSNLPAKELMAKTGIEHARLLACLIELVERADEVVESYPMESVGALPLSFILQGSYEFSV